MRLLWLSIAILGCATGSEADGEPGFDSAPKLDSAVVVDSATDGVVVDSIADTTPVDMGPVVTTGLKPHAGSEFVSAGTVTKSASYKMISNLGPLTAQPMVMKSEKYRALGGVVGATAGSK